LKGMFEETQHSMEQTKTNKQNSTIMGVCLCVHSPSNFGSKQWTWKSFVEVPLEYPPSFDAAADARRCCQLDESVADKHANK
jgi:hypothetical protein